MVGDDSPCFNDCFVKNQGNGWQEAISGNPMNISAIVHAIVIVFIYGKNTDSFVVIISDQELAPPGKSNLMISKLC